jgi:hypothetical protein
MISVESWIGFGHVSTASFLMARSPAAVNFDDGLSGIPLGDLDRKIPEG